MKRGRPYLVFLAGGIASGKSHAAQLLKSWGAVCFDLDGLSREVLQPGSDLVKRIAAEFGSDLLDEEGELNRAALGERIFTHPECRMRLEALEIPVLMDLFQQKLGEVDMDKICVLEVPLLDRIENYFDLADEILVVTASVQLRRERACKRGMSALDFDARLSAQPTDEYLLSHADSCIENDGSQEDFEEALRNWWSELNAAL